VNHSSKGKPESKSKERLRPSVASAGEAPLRRITKRSHSAPRRCACGARSLPSRETFRCASFIRSRGCARGRRKGCAHRAGLRTNCSLRSQLRLRQSLGEIPGLERSDALYPTQTAVLPLPEANGEVPLRDGLAQRRRLARADNRGHPDPIPPTGI
jgi:hypothetical protein